LNLVVEIKGYRGEDAVVKKNHDGYLLDPRGESHWYLRALGVLWN